MSDSRVTQLLLELRVHSWATRRAAVQALGGLEASAMPLLLQALRDDRSDEAQISGLVDALSSTENPIDGQVSVLLHDTNPAVVCDAAQILGRRETKSAVPELVRLTEHADDNVALSAVEALGRIGGREALDSLLVLAKSGNFFRTFPTIDVLGRSQDPRVLPTLLELSQNPLYGAEAVRALGRLGDVSALIPLLDLLATAHESLVRAIAQALLAIDESARRRFGPGATIDRALSTSTKRAAIHQKLTWGLKKADPAERLALSQLLGWVSDERTIPTLLDLLDESEAVARVAAESLRNLGAAAEPALLEALAASNGPRRRALIPLLAGKLSAIDELVACLGDPDPSTRALACDALAHCSDPRAVSALFPILADPDLRASQAALGAVQSLGSDQTHALTLDAARAENPVLRRAAIRIIGYFGYRDGLEALALGATDADEKLRDAALASLPFLETAEALALVLTGSEHPSARTRASAARALGHVPPDVSVSVRLLALLRDGDAWVRYYACQALGRQRDEGATEAIGALLTDLSGQVQVAAVDALARLRGPRAFGILEEIVDSKDPDLHRAALVALGLSGRREAVPRLLDAASSPDAATRLVALSSLNELQLADALPALTRGIDDSDEGVRVAAAGFLGARTDEDTTAALLALLLERSDNDAFILALSRPAPGRVARIAEALTNASESAASALVSSLSRNQSDEALVALHQALGSSNDSARRASAAALVAMRDTLALPLLERAALSDPDAEVRRIAAGAWQK